MSLREYIARRVAAPEIQVHQLDAFITDLPPAHTVRKSVETYTIKPALQVSVHSLNLKEKTKCKVEGFSVKQKVPQARGFRVRKFTRADVKVRGMPKKTKITIWSGLKRIQAQPIELENRLKFQKKRPALSKNEMILAWYGPIVEGAVLKLALNKQRGTLLVWYDPRSRQFKPRGVYLIRRLGLGEKPEWRWV